MLVMLLMAFNIFASVVGRWFFGREIPAVIEFSSYYYMVALTFLPLAYIELTDSHIRADIISGFLPEKFLIWFEFTIQIAMSAFFFLLAWRATVNAIERSSFGESVVSSIGDFLIWPARWIVPIGLGLACLLAAVLALRILLEGKTRSAPEILSNIEEG